MKRQIERLAVGLLMVLIVLGLTPARTPGEGGEAPRTPKQALKEFQSLIGSWRCTGEPFGTREEKLKGFWQEKIDWQWQFKPGDVWLAGTVEKGKYLRAVELRYLPARSRYQLTATTLDKETLTFEGTLDKRRLTLDRIDPKTRQTQRLVFTLLHANRYLTRYETRAEDHTRFTSVYQVGCTKEGVAFASGDDKPECIVSGGLGTMQVVYKGETYYVCCSGCRDAFREDPEKYIKEAAEAKKKK
jgi:hypothetical protein